MQLSNALRNHKGFTLIEIAIVLTIVGLIIGGIWLAASQVFTNNKAQQFAGQMIQVVQAAKNTYQGQTGTTPALNMSTALAKGLGWFPQSMQVGSGCTVGTATGWCISHPFVANAGSLAVDAVTVTSKTGNDVQISVGTAANPLPTAACGSVAATLATPSNISSLGILSINGITPGGTGNNTISPTQAAGACSATGLVFDFSVP